MYNVSESTIRRVLKRVGIVKHYRLITPLEFEQLKAAIGEPSKP